MLCQYEHHRGFEKEALCEKCGGEAECGPFMHACPKCEPLRFKKCYGCGARIIDCCC